MRKAMIAMFTLLTVLSYFSRKDYFSNNSAAPRETEENKQSATATKEQVKARNENILFYC
uniref:Uncharacterized protein n=1 Tax=Geobacillus sp. (strain WCH70) TaxID=471223 RepID=C5DAX8_GEOSW